MFDDKNLFFGCLLMCNCSNNGVGVVVGVDWFVRVRFEIELRWGRC